jgi:SpoVK/Ycf46/Vps4 family AAA+-type ATPase
MAPFYSNKKFSNIYGDEIRLIEKRIKFFIENRNWYDSKGIPYQLGFLLSGIPGTGKTSVIRAIANLTKRHIINVNFANINTATQLKNLFYSDKIQVYTDQTFTNIQTYHIPIEQRLYVLEEIDAIGDIVKQRSSDSENISTINDELTLMEILTVLDGTMEIPGRIVIMTTNHPEILDSALVRPGRIDINVKFTYSKRELIAEMFEAYLDIQFPIDKLNKLPDRKLSPAEIGEILFRHFDHKENIDAIIDDLNSSAVLKNRQNFKPNKQEELTEDNKTEELPISIEDDKPEELPISIEDNKPERLPISIEDDKPEELPISMEDDKPEGLSISIEDDKPEELPKKKDLPENSISKFEKDFYLFSKEVYPEKYKDVKELDYITNVIHKQTVEAPAYNKMMSESPMFNNDINIPLPAYNKMMSESPMFNNDINIPLPVNTTTLMIDDIMGKVLGDMQAYSFNENYETFEEVNFPKI